MQTTLQQPQQPMPEGSSESNFAQFKTAEPTSETLVSPEQLAATETASARDLVEMAYGGTVAVSAETAQPQQEYLAAIAPEATATAEAVRVVADTEVVRAATDIGMRLADLRAREINHDVQRGGYRHAA